jgi:hypothetical protein
VISKGSFCEADADSVIGTDWEVSAIDAFYAGIGGSIVGLRRRAELNCWRRLRARSSFPRFAINDMALTNASFCACLRMRR